MLPVPCASISRVTKLFRLTVYVLLCALLVSLGDGPFVDEIIAEKGEQNQQQLIANASSDQSTVATASCLCVYQTLLNFVGGGHNLAIETSTARHSQIPIARTTFASRFVAPLDKPPRTLT